MIDYEKWDKYYDENFADDESVDSFWKEYDAKRLEAQKNYYYGQKTNVTVEQIIKEMGVKAVNDKFLYGEDIVVVLLDYSKGIFDKWKNGTILYCNGEKDYTIEQDIENLSIIDSMLFNADSIGKTIIRVFWKDGDSNYRFVNGELMLGKERPYQIEENGKYRWVFPLSLISTYHFRMPEKYSFYVDVRRIKQSVIEEINKEDETRLLEFNKYANFDSYNGVCGYKLIPQEKNCYLSVKEKIIRNRKKAENALLIADFKCEIDKKHITFVEKIKMYHIWKLII